MSGAPSGPVTATAGAVSAWLRNTTTTGNISSVTDVLNANPAVQSVDARRPEGAADGSMTFLTNDVLSWPLHASNNGAAQWGCALWIEPDAGGANEMVACIHLITGGASARKVVFTKSSGNRLLLDVYINDTDGRRFSTTADQIITTAAFVTAEIDTAKVGEANQVKMTIGGVVQTFTGSNLGAGGTINSLVVPTGNVLIGNGRDGTASSPFQGRMSKNLFFLGSAMPGASAGLLTADAVTNLMAFEPLV